MNKRAMNAVTVTPVQMESLNTASPSRRKARPRGMNLSEAFKHFMPGPPPDNTGCWEWTGTRFNTGYGQLCVAGKRLTAHRVSYELFVGPIPEDLCVLHRCDNRPCCNPDHLFIGTKGDNHRDKIDKGRHAGPLTQRDADLIRAQYTALERLKRKELAQAYKVTETTIRQILNHQTWREVDDHEGA